MGRVGTNGPILARSRSSMIGPSIYLLILLNLADGPCCVEGAETSNVLLTAFEAPDALAVKVQPVPVPVIFIALKVAIPALAVTDVLDAAAPHPLIERFTVPLNPGFESVT